MINAVFPDSFERAFGCSRFMQGLAGIAIFSTSNQLCMNTKIPFILCTCLISIILYLVMEILRRREQQQRLGVVQVKQDEIVIDVNEC